MMIKVSMVVKTRANLAARRKGRRTTTRPEAAPAFALPRQVASLEVFKAVVLEDLDPIALDAATRVSVEVVEDIARRVEGEALGFKSFDVF